MWLRFLCSVEGRNKGWKDIPEENKESLCARKQKRGVKDDCGRVTYVTNGHQRERRQCELWNSNMYDKFGIPSVNNVSFLYINIKINILFRKKNSCHIKFLIKYAKTPINPLYYIYLTPSYKLTPPLSLFIKYVTTPYPVKNIKTLPSVPKPSLQSGPIP